jgi:hypothetical protein
MPGRIQRRGRSLRRVRSVEWARRGTLGGQAPRLVISIHVLTLGSLAASGGLLPRSGRYLSFRFPLRAWLRSISKAATSLVRGVPSKSPSSLHHGAPRLRRRRGRSWGSAQEAASATAAWRRRDKPGRRQIRHANATATPQVRHDRFARPAPSSKAWPSEAESPVTRFRVAEPRLHCQPSSPSAGSRPMEQDNRR